MFLPPCKSYIIAKDLSLGNTGSGRYVTRIYCACALDCKERGGARAENNLATAMRRVPVSLPLLWSVLLMSEVSLQHTALSVPYFPADAVYTYSYHSSTQISRNVSVDLAAEVSVLVRACISV